MDKPIPFWLIILTIFILVGGSFLIYLWLKNLTLKDSNDNTKRSS